MKLNSNLAYLLIQKKPLLIIMKTYVYLFCIFSFGFNTKNGFSQNEKITLDGDRLYSIEEVLDSVKRQTEYSFVYPSGLFEGTTKINLRKGEISIEKLFEKFGIRDNFVFEFAKNKVIYIRSIPIVDIEDSALQRSISGTVTDKEGVPLPGVNILEKGTANGVVSDFDGNYSISINNDNATLVFSYLGFKTYEVRIGDNSTLDVELTVESQGLDEVVVVGYGSQLRKDLTTSVSSIKEAEFENVPVASADALLQGRAAGVQVVQNSGTPGAENYVRIRGNSSLLGQNRPLYIVDGVQLNNITTNVLDAGGQLTTATNDINPNDIKSIEILKDAAATAIYGARASNGVVLITTKSGQTGKAKFTFNAYTGFQNVYKKYDLLNAEQYRDLRIEAINNTNERQNSTIPIPDFINGNGANTDWQDEIFRTAEISDINLSMTGGNEKISYYLSLGRFLQEGTIIGQGYERKNARINVDYQASEKLKIGSNMSFSYSDNDRIFTDQSSNSVLANALLFNPNLSVFNEDGSYVQDPNQVLKNPVQLANEISFNSKQTRFIGNVYGEYEILEGLKFKSVFGVDFLFDRQQRFIPNNILGFQAGAEAFAANFEQVLYSLDNTLTYNKIFGDHSITALLGYSVLEREERLLRAGGALAGSNIIETVAISVPSVPDNYITDYGLESYFGRLNYSYKDKYLASATIRIDGSSRFGADNRYGRFPAASLGWRISNENFMESLSAINDLKLRVSYGVNGNQEGIIGDFPSLATYSPGFDFLSFFPGIAQTSIANPDLTWEETTQLNLGLDFTLLQNRISGTVDVYQKNTDKLLFRRQLPWSSGFEEDSGANIGKMENKGLEISLTTYNLTGEFKWDTNFNIAFNANEITFLPGYDPNNPTESDFIQTQRVDRAFGQEDPRTIFRVGEPFGSMFGLVGLGVDPATGFYRYDNPEGTTTPEGFPLITGSFDANNRIIGNALPKHTGGFTNNFSYKGIGLSVFLQWSYGNDIYNNTEAILQEIEGYGNQSAALLNRWQQPGDITSVPRAYFIDPAGSVINGELDGGQVGVNNMEFSSRFLEDGSFLRAKDIRLSYDFPESALEKTGFLTALQLYSSVRNAFTITNYSGFDPESQNTSVVTSVGIDLITQPQPRTIIMGLKASF